MGYLNNPDHPITLLGFGTLLAVLLAAILMLWMFLRKRSHRHPMQGQRERNIEEIRAEAETPRPMDGQSGG